MTLSGTTGATPYDAVRTTSAEALLQELRSNVALTIVDVRERPSVVATGTIAGARMFPLSQLASRVTELSDLRSTPIVVVSQTARRARTAALELEMSGFEEVFVLEGGLQEWMNLGYPLEQRRALAPSWR